MSERRISVWQSAASGALKLTSQQRFLVESGPESVQAADHGLAVTANEKTAYITARGVADEIKILNLNGTDVSTILIDPRPGMADRPDSFARKGSNLYVTVRYSGQVARIKTQTGSVEYIDIAPPATTGYAVHGIAVRP